jgi:glycosyltransferase involved in cell wall biosynthesis
MKISVIMPVYLGEYPGCASDRVRKFQRAVKSFDLQTYIQKELIIVCDGGWDEIKKALEPLFILNKDKITFIEIEKQHLFSGNVRNEGLKVATGDIICYLDSDDFFGRNHLMNIADNFPADCQWVHFNDYVSLLNGDIICRNVFPYYGKIGTSSIAHRRSIGNWKGCDGYGHDYLFIENLCILKTKRYGAANIMCATCQEVLIHKKKEVYTSFFISLKLVLFASIPRCNKCTFRRVLITFLGYVSCVIQLY